MRTRFNLSLLLVAGVLAPALAHAQFGEWAKKIGEQFGGGGDDSAAVAGLSQQELAAGLREALGQGTRQAVQTLGQENGFWGNEKYRIPLPGPLATGAETLRSVGGGQLVDQFQLTLNRAAEQAVPQTAEILGNAVSALTLQDAADILGGPDDAATDYFRETSSDEIYDRILPIVSRATENTGVANLYKQLNSQSGGFMKVLMPNAENLDDYVAQQTMSGLFTAIAAEEQRIRENPAARGSEILRKVFSAYN